MVLKLILAWLALQLPLGILIGTCIQHGMVQRRCEEGRTEGAAPVSLHGARALAG
jgi:hypothetical protein